MKFIDLSFAQNARKKFCTFKIIDIYPIVWNVKINIRINITINATFD